MNKTPDLISELRAEIQSAPPGELPSIRGQLAELEAELLARLFAQRAVPIAEASSDESADVLLTVEETAERLGQKAQWVRAHQNELPRVQLPGRSIRFSAKRLDAWLNRRSA